MYSIMTENGVATAHGAAGFQDYDLSALEECARTMDDGDAVVYLDYNNHPAAVESKRRSLRITRYEYCQPDAPFDPEPLLLIMDQWPFRTVHVVVDSVDAVERLEGHEGFTNWVANFPSSRRVITHPQYRKEQDND